MDKKINPFLKFAIWMVVIIIMITVSFIKGNNENHWLDEIKQRESSKGLEVSSENIITYPVMQDILKDNNYEFVFTISNDFKYTYTGRRCNGLETGFKETKDGIIKYIIDSDKKMYKIVDDDYEEITDLYSGFDSQFLDINLLFNNLDNALYIKDNNTYKYQNTNYQVDVITNNEYIKTIIIKTGNTLYNLEFANIGKCAKIDFNN